MASLVTGIIGGIQGRNAAKDAASAQEQAAQKAGDLYGQGVAEANPIYDKALQYLMQIVPEAATNATGRVDSAVSAGQTGVANAAQQANAGLAPFLSQGGTSLQQLMDLATQQNTMPSVDLYKDPGYEFRIKEDQKAFERSAAARYGALGGAAAKGLQDRSQAMASQEYQNAFARANQVFQNSQQDRTSRMAALSGVAGLGLNAANASARNTMDAAGTSAQLGYSGATYGGNAGLHAADTLSQARMGVAGLQARNVIDAGEYKANMAQAAGNAQAAGHIGAANAWNGMLGSIGKAGDAFIGGAFPTTGGFSLKGGFRGLGGL